MYSYTHMITHIAVLEVKFSFKDRVFQTIGNHFATKTCRNLHSKARAYG